MYENVDVGGTSPSKIFVVSNTGKAELAVTATTLSDRDQFEISGGIESGGNPVKVGPGATHHVEVRFALTSDGRKQASLDITSNDPARPTVKVTLEGFGDPGASPQSKKP